MALTCSSQNVFDAFYDKQVSKGFFHGHTYSANPLACAAAIAGMDLLASDRIQNSIRRIAERHLQFEAKIKEHAMVRSTRSLGVIFALDLNLETERYGNLRDRLYRYFMDEGVFLRPLGNTIYLLPPFTISEEELTALYASILKCLEMLSDD